MKTNQKNCSSVLNFVSVPEGSGKTPNDFSNLILTFCPLRVFEQLRVVKEYRHKAYVLAQYNFIDFDNYLSWTNIFNLQYFPLKTKKATGISLSKNLNVHADLVLQTVKLFSCTKSIWFCRFINFCKVSTTF